MTRSILSGIFAILGISAIALVPTACQSGGVGDPCIPEDEYDPNFAGFKVEEENIESRSFQCDTRICLANYFQGRVSCPLGQPRRQACEGPDDGSCEGDGEKCVEAATLSEDCTKNSDCDAFSGGEGEGKCKITREADSEAGTPAEGFCQCSEGGCPAGYSCVDGQCKSYVCHKPGSCQVAKGDAAEGDNDGKGCCVPGTDIPVAASVCGQCNEKDSRDAPNAVYCSCRCGVAEGEEEDPNFNFCECPEGFECAEIRKNVGLGDPLLTGKYCIKAGTGTDAVTATQQCGQLAEGSFGAGTQQCSGSL